MDLKRVCRIEQSVTQLLADPEASQLTKPQQKEWKAIDVSLQHLIEKLKGDEQGGQRRPAPPRSSFSASQLPVATNGQAPALKQSTPATPPDGVQTPGLVQPQGGTTGETGSDQSIENQVMSSDGSSLDSMLYELEMALKAAQQERAAGRGLRTK